VVRGRRYVFNDQDLLKTFVDKELVLIPESKKKNLAISCSGGGMMRHTCSCDAKDIMIYGHSVPYGRADHQKTYYILLKDFPGYKIRWSNNTNPHNNYSEHH